MSLFGQSSGPSLFGTNNQQNSQTKPLFGSSTAAQPQAATGLFGSSTSQPQQTSGLFGANSTTQQPQPQSNSLFGASTAQPSGSGLFGSNANQQAQNQQGTSLFGGLNQGQNQNQNQNQNQQQPQTGGLFGSSSTQNKPTVSLFGNTNNQTQQQPSLFSAPNLNISTNVQQQQQQQQSQNTSSAFGTSARYPNVLSLGQGAQTQTQTVPGVKIDVSNIRGTTRFNDIHEDLQKQIEQIDNFIQQQISYKEQCDAIMPAHEQSLASISNDVEFVTNKLNTSELALDNDGSAANYMKSTVQKDVEDARICFRAVENLKLPQQFHYTGLSSISARSQGEVDSKSASEEGHQDLIGYFSSKTTSLDKTLEQYKTHITEIEDHLRNVELSAVSQTQQIMFRQDRDGGKRSTDDQTLELQSVLKQFEAGILGVAEHVAGLRENVTEVIGQGYAAGKPPR